MAAIHCSACGKETADATSTCSHCGKSAASADRPRRRGLPVWGKLLLMLLLGAGVVSLFVFNKPTEAELRQAIRDKAKLTNQGPAPLIDLPQFADRFTFHNYLLSCEIKFTKDNGDVVRVAVGQLGGITVAEGW